MNRSLTFSLCAAVSLAGCADRSNEISASYVSPIPFQSYSCTQLSQEAQRVSSRAAQVAGVQDEKASGDAVATGVALVLFWPAVFFIKGNKQNAAELGRLKGELEAIEQASIQKNCGITFARPTQETRITQKQSTVKNAAQPRTETMEEYNARMKCRNGIKQCRVSQLP